MATVVAIDAARPDERDATPPRLTIGAGLY
jgi:hypothetical protein